jgi:hypothetical protein
LRILELHIDGYGVFRDQHVQDFGDGVVLFSGPNEAGKSTLMSFVRGVLFGFERESQAGYYPPLLGGRHGGRLVVEMRDGDEVVVERYAERGQPKAPASVVGNMSKALYSNVFAFSLAELASLESLGSEEVRARIYSAGAGLFAFSAGIACGVLLGKLMYKLSGGKVNPLIGAAGISAVPMAARVCQQVGLEEDPNNHLLMHAMGANVGGQIASAVAAGVMMAIFS